MGRLSVHGYRRLSPSSRREIAFMGANTQSKAPITAAQIKKIHALKTALGFDDGLYRFILSNSFGVTSSKDLNSIQAGGLIEIMEAKAVECGSWERSGDKPKKFSALASRCNMASPEQLRKIEAQWAEVSRVPPEEREKALRRFVYRIAKVSALRFLDQEGAGKVINALTAMQKQGKPLEKGKTR